MKCKPPQWLICLTVCFVMHYLHSIHVKFRVLSSQVAVCCVWCVSCINSFLAYKRYDAWKLLKHDKAPNSVFICRPLHQALPSVTQPFCLIVIIHVCYSTRPKFVRSTVRNGSPLGTIGLYLSFQQSSSHYVCQYVWLTLFRIQLTLDISHSDISNSAKFETSIWIKNTFWLLYPTIILR